MRRERSGPGWIFTLLTAARGAVGSATCVTAVVIALIPPTAAGAGPTAWAGTSAAFMPEPGITLSEPTYCIGPTAPSVPDRDCLNGGRNTPVLEAPLGHFRPQPLDV